MLDPESYMIVLATRLLSHLSPAVAPIWSERSSLSGVGSSISGSSGGAELPCSAAVGAASMLFAAADMMSGRGGDRSAEPKMLGLMLVGCEVWLLEKLEAAVESERE